MTQYIIIICIITILLWYYYTKSKENDNKYLPMMIRQSELIQENSQLKQDNKKLKLRVKYLENYKNDVSKTFKILDNELLLINEHIKQNRQANTTTTTPQEEPNTFQTNLTPSVLHSLIRNSNESLQSDNLFNNIFNRFLTGDMNFAEQLPPNNTTTHQENQQQEPQPQQNQQQEPQELQLQQPQPQELQQEQSETEQSQTQPQTEPLREQSNNVPQSQASLRFSVNYLPLNTEYRQFLIRRNNNNNNSQNV